MPQRQPPQPPKPKLGDRLGDEWIKQEISRFVDAVEGLATPRITLDVSDRLYDLLVGKRVMIIRIGTGAPIYSGLTPNKGDGTMAQYVIPNDTPDGTYTLPDVVVKDAEGEVLTVGVKETFESSNGDVVSLTPTGSESIKEGTYHVGKSGTADVHHTVTLRGEPVYDHVDNFVVTKGEPATVEVEGEPTYSGLEPAGGGDIPPFPGMPPAIP